MKGDNKNQNIEVGPTCKSAATLAEGAPAAIRTRNLWIRSPLLCPIELQGQQAHCTSELDDDQSLLNWLKATEASNTPVALQQLDVASTLEGRRFYVGL